MQIRPFQDGTPEIFSLDTDFEVPDWWRPTGCRWNSTRRRGGRDQDGQTQTKYLKKFAQAGSVDSYKFGTIAGFERGGGSQPGLVCSAEALFMVVECDDPESWDAELLGDAEPTVRSRRGYHYYFAVDPSLVSLLPTDGPVPGGDVQTKGFVPAPGTIHPSGAVYELVARKINLADAELLDRLRAARQRIKDEHVRAYRERGGEGWHGDGGINGQDDYLALVVCWNAVKEGKTEAEARETWFREAAALPLKDADDPFDEDDFQRHYRGACRKRHELDAAAGERTEVDEAVRAWADALGAARGGGETAGPEGEHPGGGGSEGGGGELGEEEWGRFLPRGYILPAGFEMGGGGIMQETGSGKTAKLTQATVLPVYVSGIEVDSDGVSWYELTWLTHDLTTRQVTIPSGHVANRNRLIENFPEVVIDSQGSAAASQYLSACRRVNSRWLAAEGRTRKVALRLGWYGDGDEFAAGPGRPFPVRDTANLGSWLQGHVAHGSLDDWCSAMQAMPPKVVILAAAALAAPLLKLLEVQGFVVDNAGSTTGGKTRAARVAASVWGDPDRLLLSWSATTASLELRARKAHGIPLFLDDSKLARDSQQISDMVYQTTSGMSTGRLERSADKLRNGEGIRTIVITNGEAPLLTAGRGGKRDAGAIARVLELWGAPFPSAQEADAANAMVKENYGLAGKEFVEGVLSLGVGELRSRLEEMKAAARSMTKTNVARRRADAGAVVMLAASIATDMGLLPKVADETWFGLLNDDAAEEGSDDRALNALGMLQRKVATDPRLFWAPEKGMGDGVLDGLLGIAGGWGGRLNEKDGWLAVSPEWLRRFLTDEGEDAEGILRQWEERGWTARGERGRRKVKVRINGKLVEVYKITEGFGRDEQAGVTASEEEA